ncbi:MAG: right-handed parallel beta-helix repeat-containing protein, partial [Bacteroidales bacterium]|nr:right-handed parallel beta-helix repeat-containing protein [Bacteroidales bacterium]
TGYGIKSNSGKSVGLLSHCDIYNCTSGIFGSILGRIEYSNIYNNTEYGIDGRYSQIETIYECTISDNKKRGITSGQGTLKKLLNSIIKNNGIGFDNQTGTTEIIRNCSFIDNEECAVYFNNATLDSISDCFLSGSKTAIKFERVSGYGNFTILENYIIGKDGKHADFKGYTIGVFISNMCGVVLENNIISGNKSSGIAIDQKPSVTIRNNFIGTNLSGDALGNGVGVKLYDYVGGS